MMREMNFKQLLLLGLCALFVWPFSAAAHTRLIKSEPAASAIVALPLPTMALEFSAPPEQEFTRVELRMGNQWKALPVSQMGRRVEARLPTLPAGKHQVRWSVISRDGHRLNGQLSFTIR